MTGLTLNLRTEYGVRLCLALAHTETSRWTKARELSDATGVSPAFATQVLGELIRAGLVESAAGRHGGYRLARAPATISLLEVIESLAGEVVSHRCILWGGPCQPADCCALHDAWHGAQRTFATELQDIDIASVADAARSPLRPLLEPAAGVERGRDLR